MRTFPFDRTLGIGALFSLLLPNGTIRVCTGEADISDGTHTWLANPGTNLTQILTSSDGSPDAADIKLDASSISGLIRPGQAARRELMGWPITIELFDLNDTALALGTFNYLPGAIIGSCREDSDGNVVIAAQGPLARTRKPMAEVYTVTCKALYGDDRCKKPVVVPDVARATAYFTVAKPGGYVPAQVFVRVKSGLTNASYNNVYYECTTAGTSHATIQPVYPTTPGLTVTDGTAVFTCRAAELVSSTGQGLDFFNVQLAAAPAVDPSALGNIIPRSGPMNGRRIMIRSYDPPTKIVTLWEPFSPSLFPPATEFDTYPGCDKLYVTCRDVKNNLVNMRATPFAPNSDLIAGRA